MGASLAGTRLGDRSWGARATLLVAANLPDVDVVAYFWGGDAALGFRRGWTHGILAIVVLPLLLSALVYAVGRARKAQGLRVDQILLLSALGLATHPSLDWLNTYGMRWLMPFDDSWSYGDALFIVDPWLWLMLGGAAFLRFSRTPRAAVLWTVLAILASASVLGTGAVPFAGRLLWLAGLSALAAVRWAGGPMEGARGSRVCAAALGAASLYALLMLGGTWYAETGVRKGALEPSEGTFHEVFAGPLPADPSTRDVLLIGDARYLPGTFDLFDGFTLAGEPIPVERADPRVGIALSAPCSRGMRTWMRFPFFAIEEVPGGSVVHLLDARYVREPDSGFGATQVRLAEDGSVLGCG